MTFEDEDISNVNGNPLPNHGGLKVNAVKSSQDLQVKRDVKDVCMPIRLVYEGLVKAGRLKDRQGKEEEEMDQKNATADIMMRQQTILSKNAQISSR